MTTKTVLLLSLSLLTSFSISIVGLAAEEETREQSTRLVKYSNLGTCACNIRQETSNVRSQGEFRKVETSKMVCHFGVTLHRRFDQALYMVEARGWFWNTEHKVRDLDPVYKLEIGKMFFMGSPIPRSDDSMTTVMIDALNLVVNPTRDECESKRDEIDSIMQQQKANVMQELPISSGYVRDGAWF